MNPNNSRKPLYHIFLSKCSLVQECHPGSKQPGSEVGCPLGLANRLTKGETAHKDHVKLNQAASFQPNQENFSILSGWPCIYNSSSVEWAHQCLSCRGVWFGIIKSRSKNSWPHGSYYYKNFRISCIFSPTAT